MKKKILLIGFIGVFIGLVISWITYEGLHRTSDDRFCSVCHEMNPMVLAYHQDPHGGNGTTGIKVNCVNCHLPHDNIFKYIFTKARNGVVEGAIHFFGDPGAIDWHKNREKKIHFVEDGGCIACHPNYKTNEHISAKGHKMHKHYAELIGTDKEISCASCHVEVGHQGLRSMLNYYSPEYDYYKGKIDKKKPELEKQLAEEFSRE